MHELRGDISSRFSWANASEFLENREGMFPRYLKIVCYEDMTVS